MKPVNLQNLVKICRMTVEEIFDHAENLVAEDGMLISLEESGMLGSPAESKMVISLAESGVLGSLGERGMLGSLAENGLLGSTAESGMLGSLAENGMLDSIAKSKVRISPAKSGVPGSPAGGDVRFTPLIDAKIEPRVAVIRSKTYIYLPGNTRYPLLVCHADTVHKRKPTSIVYDRNLNAISSPSGIGADDRAGVYAILELWKDIAPHPGVLITDKEETGGIGAWDAAQELPLDKYPYFIEMDFGGSRKVCFYNNEPNQFRRYITSFGFREVEGLFSDISILGRELGVCSANVSIGSYNNHRTEEYLVLYQLQRSMKTVAKIMRDTYRNPVEYTLPPPLPATPWLPSRYSWDRTLERENRPWQNGAGQWAEGTPEYLPGWLMNRDGAK